MKKFLTLLSIFTVIFTGYTNNLLAQDDSDAVIITEEDEELCPFCNALAAAQANNMGCIILVQAPDGTVQMAKSCPPPKGAKPCKTGKNCKPCPTCKKKINPLSNPATPSKEEMTADKALKD